MMERGHDRDALQCRIKVKELRSSYRKAREANSHSGAPPVTCRFYKELDAILGGDPTSTPSTTMDTSEWEEEEEESRSDGAEVGGNTLESWRHAARNSSRARRKIASCSSRYLVKNKQKSRFPMQP
nr:zinc finger and SCAN domain-containing protein 20-like [Chelonoidis abingdonii]